MRLSTASISSFKRLDDLHSAAAARTRWRIIGRSSLIRIIVVVVRARRRRRQQLAAKLDFGGAVAVCEQAVMTNAMETVRQGVHQKAPNELASLERHRFAPTVLAIILPAEGHTTIGQRDQPAVGNGDAMGVAREISEHLLGAGEWTLGKYDPFAPAQRREILLERRWGFKDREIGKELKLAGSECRVEILQEQPAEETRQHPNGQVEVWSARNPALAARGYSTTWHDAVDVGMVIEVLTPCMEDGGQTDPGAQMFGIGGDGRKRLGSGLEQQAVHLGLVLVGNGSDLRRQREHDMEVGKPRSRTSRATGHG